MLACLLGHSREIFFPKLSEEQMMTFSAIADAFLTELGYEVKPCGSEEEARRFAAEMPRDSGQYPVYYFKSDTTGEKSYEEFYVSGEHTDMERFVSLGVIDQLVPRSKHEVDSFLEELKKILSKDDTKKETIVEAIKAYLPNFRHEEKGRNLDQKM